MAQNNFHKDGHGLPIDHRALASSPTDIIREYWALHIPTGERLKRRGEFAGDVSFYRALDSFNANNPGVWQYWAA